MPAKSNSTPLLPNDLYDSTKADKTHAVSEQVLGMGAPTDPLLSLTAKYVEADELGSPRIKAIISRLHAAALGQRNGRVRGPKRRTLVGLAAPQIGESVRIVLIDTKVTASRKKYSEPECFINPEIVWRSRETQEGREGCFSAGPVWGLVRRPIAVKIRALKPDGTEVEHIFEGFTARIAQHEIDHLDGIRFPDRIKSDKKRHWVHAEEIEFYPKLIHKWERICTLERWEQYKTTGL